MTQLYEMPKVPVEDIFPPQTYRLAVVSPKPKEKTDGGIVLPDAVKDHEKHFQYIGRIVVMGPSCFKDKPEWKHCQEEDLPKVGDFVAFNSKDGMKMEIKNEDGEDVEIRYIFDTSIITKIKDPGRYKFFY